MTLPPDFLTGHLLSWPCPSVADEGVSDPVAAEASLPVRCEGLYGMEHGFGHRGRGDKLAANEVRVVHFEISRAGFLENKLRSHVLQRSKFCDCPGHSPTTRDAGTIGERKNRTETTGDRKSLSKVSIQMLK